MRGSAEHLDLQCEIPHITSSSTDKINFFIKENSELRSKLVLLSKEIENQKTNYERKCGAVEYELEQCLKMNQMSVIEHDRRYEQLVQKNKSLLEEMEEIRSNIKLCKASLEDETNRNVQLNAYLAKLPTIEEHEDVLRQLKLLQQRSTDLEKRLGATQTQLECCEAQLGEANAKLKRCAEREQVLQTQLDNAMQRLYAKSGTDQTPGIRPRVTPEFVEDLQCERDRYRCSFEQVKKLLEAETHRAEAADACLRMTKRQFEEQLAREEATVTGLKASVAVKHTEIRQLKARLSELNTEKQELFSQLLDTRSSLSQMNHAWKSTDGRQRCRLLCALIRTVDELSRLAQHMTQLASGGKPDLASLLCEPQAAMEWPCTTTPTDCDSALSGDGEDVTTDYSLAPFAEQNSSTCVSDMTSALHLPTSDLRTQMEQIEEAYERLVKLRQKLTDHYADYLGGKLDCLVQ